MNPYTRCFSVLMLLCATLAAQATVQEDLRLAQQDARALIDSGQRLEAAKLLLESLRNLAPDAPEAAEAALESLQVLIFLSEELMTEEETKTLFRDVVTEAEYETDRLAAVLLRYGLGDSMSQEEANRNAVDVSQLSRKSEHPGVRLVAWFIMSIPQYFHDTPGAQKGVDRIAEDFGGTFLAREAQRLALYAARGERAAGLQEVLEREAKDGSLREHCLRLREDLVGAAIYAALQQGPSAKADLAVVRALSDLAAATADPEIEDAALNILDGFACGETAGLVEEAATAALSRANDPRVMFRARVLRLNARIALGNTAGTREDALALLDSGDVPLVAERNNLKVWKKSIQQAADFLGEHEMPQDAATVLNALAELFPRTALSATLAQQALQILQDQAAEGEPQS